MATRFSERHGYVRKRSGFGGAVVLLAGIGLFVGGAAVAGLWYASLDQPVSTGQRATEPAPTESATGEAETSAATLPATSSTLPRGDTADAGETKPPPAEKSK